MLYYVYRGRRFNRKSFEKLVGRKLRLLTGLMSIRQDGLKLNQPGSRHRDGLTIWLKLYLCHKEVWRCPKLQMSGLWKHALKCVSVLKS